MCGDLANEGLNSTVEQLFDHALKMAAENQKNGLIDPLYNLKGAPKIDIVSDTDPVISSEQMKANQKIFNNFGANTKFVNIGVAHAWTVEFGDNVTPRRPKCEKGKDYQGNCDYDFSGEILKHLYFNMP